MTRVILTISKSIPNHILDGHKLDPNLNDYTFFVLNI